MLVLSSVFGAATCLLGTALSARFSQMPTGPIIVLIGTSVFLISLLFAPRRGFITRTIANRQFEDDVLERRLLVELYDFWERQGDLFGAAQGLLEDSWTPSKLARAVLAARRRGELVVTDRG